MAKVFLSHSSKDATLASAIHASLTTLHHQTFLDHDPGDGIEPGADWERTLYEKLQWADALVCIVTRNYLASLWCSIEVAIAKSQGRRIVPLAAERGLVHPLLKQLQYLAYIDDTTAAFTRLADQLATIDAGGGVAWNTERDVFPGLVAFDTDDRAMFFGRDQEIRDVVNEIRARVGQRQPRALIVVGASGSGKSSLVRAGVTAGLLDDPAWWRLQPIMPGNAPFVALTDALARGRKKVDLAPGLQVIAQQLPGGLATLCREILLSAPGDRQHLLIVVDQMEELFTRANDSDRRAFLTMLSSAASEPDGPVAVVATMRSEFLSELLRAPEGQLLRERPFLLAPIGTEHLEEVIEKPAQKAHISFDRALVRRLVEDTGSGEALPLLAFTLARLVDGLRPGDRVDLARYEASGGVRKSVEIQAEAALSAAQTAAACTDAEALAALMRFVTIDDAGRPARRQRRRSDLPSATDKIVSAFEQARLLTTDTGKDAEGNDVEFVSVAHETLFTAWDRMAKAIADATTTLRLRRELERASDEWNRAGRSPAFLWRGERLASAQRLLTGESDLGADARTFVLTSAAAALEEAQREAVMLADRVDSNGLVESDPELALLYLLAAVDEYAPTPSAIAGMRRALAAQRMVGRVGPFEHEVLFAMVSDDGALLAVSDLGTNRPIRPSTRPQPKPPAGAVELTLWRIRDRELLSAVAIPGRDVFAIEWSRDGRMLVVAIDSRVDVLDTANLATLSSIDVSADAGTRRDWLDWRWIEISPDNKRIEIDRGEHIKAFVLDSSVATWVRADAPAPGQELQRGVGEVAQLPRFSRLVDCPHAGRLLNIASNIVEVWAAEPVDAPLPTSAAEQEGALWMPGPTADDELLALSYDGRLRCVGWAPRLIDDASNTEKTLPWSFAVAAGFSGDGRRLAVASRMEIGVIDTATNQLVTTMGRHSDEEGDTYSSVALNHDGTVLVSGSLGGGRSHAWDVASGRSMNRIDARWVGMSRDGTLIAAAAMSALTVHFGDDTVLALDTLPARRLGFDSTKTSLLAVRGPATEYSLPDGSRAPEYPAMFDRVGFSPDGRHVIARSGDHFVQWPDRSDDAVIARARRAVYRSLTQPERDNYELRSRPPTK